jgi:uncharacterized protein YndB with AHSA1/START domain
MNVQPGGKWRILMRGPDGSENPGGGIYHEIVKPEKLVFTINHSEMSEEWHDIVNPGRDRSKGRPALEALTTVLFEDQSPNTKLTIRLLFESVEVHDMLVKLGMNEGWSQSLERLNSHVSTPQSLVVERLYKAPVAAVWNALTDKAAIKQWAFEFSDFKPEVGFKFQFTATDKGFTYIHHSVVKEVIPQKKLAYSWRYEGYEGDSLVTFELFPEGNITRLRLTHQGLETFPQIPAFARANFEAGWNAIIGSSLKAFVEKESA